MPAFFNRRTLVCVACFLIGCLGSYLAGQHIGFDKAADRRRQLPNGAIHCKAGPWGDLSYTPFTIAAPGNLLPIRTWKSKGTHWFLKGCTIDALAALLESTSLPPERRSAFLDPSVLHVEPDGIELTPPPDLVFSLPEDARGKIYQLLAQSVLGQSDINIIPKDSLDERFSAEGVSADTVALFKQLCYQRGNYVQFSSFSAIFSRIPGYDEKVRLVKALTRQRTLLLRLHITPKTDTRALAEYWSKGAWNTDVETILQSLTAIPTGTWMNIDMVLPPLPTAELYNFPTADNPLDGAPVNRDCHWSSFNFFRNVPDPNFGNPEFAFRELKENYVPASGDPGYGDVVILTKPDGSIIHSAVYIADDICFTKNGRDLAQPWMLSTISDIVDEYSVALDPGQRLTVNFYRDKRL